MEKTGQWQKGNRQNGKRKRVKWKSDHAALQRKNAAFSESKQTAV
jgi:hypothetical protein